MQNASGSEQTVKPDGDQATDAIDRVHVQVHQLMRELSYQRELLDLLVARRQVAESGRPATQKNVDYWTREVGTDA